LNRDFIFEAEPIPVPQDLPEVIVQRNEAADTTTDIWQDFKPLSEEISAIGGGDASSVRGDTSSNESGDDDSEPDLLDLGPDKRANTQSWLNVATHASELKPAEYSD